MTEKEAEYAETYKQAEKHLAHWSKLIKIPKRARISVDVSEKTGSVPALTHVDRSSKRFTVVINPKLAKDDKALSRAIGHELIHVAYISRFGWDNNQALEWLTDEFALNLLGEKRGVG